MAKRSLKDRRRRAASARRSSPPAGLAVAPPVIAAVPDLPTNAEPSLPRPTDLLDRAAGWAITIFVLYVAWHTFTVLQPTSQLPWFTFSDENVVLAEVIRFSGLDFHQHFYDMPGTPLMLLGAAEWGLVYGFNLLRGFHDGINSFSFLHIQLLTELMRVNNLLFFVLSALLLFRIVSKVTNKVSGALAAIVLLLNPAYASTAASLRVEPMAMSFMLLAVIVLTECQGHSRAWWAGVLGGIGVACRLHSVTAAVPLLTLLLVSQTWGRQADYQRGFCRVMAFVAGGVVVLAGALFYLFGRVDSPIHATYPLAFALLAKASLAAGLLAVLLTVLYFVRRLRPIIVNIITPELLRLVGGFALGSLLGMPTIFTQYKFLLQSINFYQGSSYRDPVVTHQGLYNQIVSFVSFYGPTIAPDRLTLVLLTVGVLLALFRPKRGVAPYLVVGAGYFVSKPLDLVRAPHHVALWIPCYALLCALPIAMAWEIFQTKRRLSRGVAAISAILVLFVFWQQIRNGPGELLTASVATRERMHNIVESRAWMGTQIPAGSTIKVAFYCFGPEIFYSWLHDLGLNVPTTAKDGRHYELWWGERSALKGKSGYACLSPTDLPFMERWEARQPGEGINPLREKEFHLVRSFGQGPNQISVLQFDMR